EILGQRVEHRTQAEVQLLHPAGHAHRPSLVAEMALQLPHDRGRRVRRELEAALRVETVDRFEQAHRGHLYEVVEGLPAVHEASGEVLGESQVGLYEVVAQLGVAGAAEFLEGPAQRVAIGGVERYQRTMTIRWS